MSRYELHGGDCRDVLARFSEASIDACVTDPPYELGFMGKEWDRAGVAFDPATWRAVLRVLKPGAHLLAFGGTRTFHRMTCAIEDAGFEIRDCLSWMYGTGFPKSLDVSKAIDKEYGAERTERPDPRWMARYPNGPGGNNNPTSIGSDRRGGSTLKRDVIMTSDPVTAEAQRWSGWGTALKPAWEPIILARKPLAGTVAANVQEHGTGALNIDACRIPLAGESAPTGSGNGSAKSKFGQVATSEGNGGNVTPESGRWPANVVLDDDAAAMLNEQSGESCSTGGINSGTLGKRVFGKFSGDRVGGTAGGLGDTGGASRFFYCAKVSPEERGDSDHPTMKPVELMRWLVRLVTPPGGLVCDPFTGSGSTGVAALRDGFRFIGIERDDHYREDIARPRLDAESAQGNLFAAEGAR